ncbi:lysoplasmalogenase [Pseudohoeflea suaedae]|uniref:Lysoplasmalogenase n=1 Tax=Pseudohoeflea suaedae TaxID=877384 RepID=A0A4R5PHX6_9HYPH|nr:lysoplasmalogenase [Pseudohoeflea suaedae]TDH34819.1 lysoplasmalogenase [Pseudohoeflea suaedae]
MTLLIETMAYAAAIPAAVYLPYARRAPSVFRTVIKTLPLSIFAVIALATDAPWLLVAALALSALGDACLAQEGEMSFLAGLCSFLLAHIAYAVIFLAHGGGWAAASAPVLSAIAVFSLVYGSFLVRRAGQLAVPVAIYVLAIAVMGFGAATIGGTVLLGALLFMASDAILGAEKFVMADDHRLANVSAPAVWILYFAGQALILCGFMT